MGKKSFALHWNDRVVLKLDKDHQHLLFEVGPKAFQPCSVGTGVWSYVVLENLDDGELANLVVEAWTSIVPKKVSRPIVEAARS